MKKKAVAKKRVTRAKGQPDSFALLIGEVRGLIQSARHTAANAVNVLQVLTNFEIGRRIVEYEQKGEKRAGYGIELIKELSLRLTEEFGKGFSVSNLQLIRRFFLENEARIQQTLSVKSGDFDLGQAASDPSAIPRTASGGSSPEAIWQTLSVKSAHVFGLNWSHYVLLMSIEDRDERSFYEIEAKAENWSLRELKRQVASCLYERIALSRKKHEVRKLAAEGQIVTQPEDVLKDPFVLEFLGLDETASYSESELEQAIINRIEHFLLELGKGFLFESRQRRFTFDDEHFYVDLVFYNRLLRCYVLIDLKLDKITHQDLGQMQMYVNYFDRHVKLEEENPTVGILLCKRKKEAIVELTLPRDANIHAREYKLYLPSKELLKKKLLEWTREQGKKA